MAVLEPSYGAHLRTQADDEREWGGTPPRVRERTLAAEAEIERLRTALEHVADVARTAGKIAKNLRAAADALETAAAGSTPNPAS